LNFLNRCFKNAKISDFMKVCVMGAKLFCAEGRTDRQAGRQADRQAGRRMGGQAGMAKLVASFHNFVNVPDKRMQVFLNPHGLIVSPAVTHDLRTT
jgi:hypothetical protein